MKNLCFLVLISSIIISAQQERVNILGAVQFEYEEGIYENISITNLQTKQQVYTNILGRFNIKAQPNDTLKIEALHIFTEEITVSNNNYSHKTLLALIEPLYIELADVNAYPFQLTGNLEYDAKRIKYKSLEDELIEKMKLPMGKKRDEWAHLTTPVWTPMTFTSLNLDALYQVLSGNRKRGQALFVYEERRNIVHSIKDYYTEAFFTDSIKIPKKEIIPFIITVYETTPLKSIYKSKNYYQIQLLLARESYYYRQRLLKRSTNN